MSAKLISIIGPPACGKTTLAEALAVELPAEMIREDYAGNPFLAESYLGRGDARLPGQLYFLMSRVEQLSQASWPASGLRVSDYGFCQDRIFARHRLDAGEFEIYLPLEQRLERLVHPPDLLVVLTAQAGELLARIERRGRAFEKVMTAEFLCSMQRAYEEAAAAAGCPVMRIDTAKTDIRKDQQCRELAEEILAKIGNNE